MISDPMKVLMTVLGILLLLPGVCALAFATILRFDPTLTGLWMICFFISAGGVFILYRTYRQTETDRPPDP